jgi:hypothetical protein
MTPFDDDARRWARTVLGMSASDDPRFALLRKLRTANFMPLADVGAAFRVCAEADGIAGADATRVLESAGYAHEREQRRLRLVESFAENFFAMSPTDRAAVFRALTVECRGDAILAGRLARLGRGLEIDLARPGLSSEEERVVSILRELFPLAPDERALRRRRLLRQVRNERGFDGTTLHRLAANWPELERLDPELWRHLGKAVSPALTTTPSTGTASGLAPVILSAPPRAPIAPPPRPPVAPSQPKRWFDWRLITYLLILVGSIAAHLNATRSGHRNERPEAQKVDPAFDPRVVGDLKKPPEDEPTDADKK